MEECKEENNNTLFQPDCGIRPKYFQKNISHFKKSKVQI
jgi:hypothetical protein